ncbi:MAG: hypothetical protein QW594_01615, partial [Candidatus Woesearchaeota archaeon]
MAKQDDAPIHLQPLQTLLLHYIPRGGNRKKVGQSKVHRQGVYEGVIPYISDNLLYSYAASYALPNEAMQAVRAPGNLQPLLRAFEQLSLLPSVEKTINQAIRRSTPLSVEELTHIVQEYYPSLYVPGRLSTIIMNMAKVLPLKETRQTHDDYQAVPYTLRNPFSPNQTIMLESFLEESPRFGKYHVRKEFLPPNIEQIFFAADELVFGWQEILPSYYIPRTPKENVNHVHILYKKTVPSSLLMSIEKEIENLDLRDFVKKSEIEKIKL